VSVQLLRPDSVEAAAAALGNGSVALGGGTDLVPLLRDGIVSAETLVELRGVVPRGVQATRIGAGTMLAELEADSEIPQALREACALAASPQLRSMGTIGGNLLQATRCWYWRLKFPCFLHGGERCHARQGAHREHAIFGNERCASAHPSDPAAALVALGATLRTDRRELPVEELYRLPTDDDRDVTALEAGELLLELDVPPPEASVYLKAMDRTRFSFALVGVAAARFKTDARAKPAHPPSGIASDVETAVSAKPPRPPGGIASDASGEEVRLALAGVAPIPWRLESPDDLDRATPLPGTAYKVDLARPLIRRALEAVA
jgi:xanthine dehydrogenase YagS FAD-binding subunit